MVQPTTMFYSILYNVYYKQFKCCLLSTSLNSFHTSIHILFVATWHMQPWIHPFIQPSAYFHMWMFRSLRQTPNQRPPSSWPAPSASRGMPGHSQARDIICTCPESGSGPPRAWLCPKHFPETSCSYHFSHYLPFYTNVSWTELNLRIVY